MYKHIPVFVLGWFALAALAENDSSKTSTPPAVATKTAALSTFESLDKNGDQRISRTEAGMDKHLSNTFGAMDTDGDGYISKAEFTVKPQS